MDIAGKIDLKEQLKSLFDTGINLSIGQIGAIQWAINQVTISKTETTNDIELRLSISYLKYFYNEEIKRIKEQQSAGSKQECLEVKDEYYLARILKKAFVTLEEYEQLAISKTETTTEPCWYCGGIEGHEIVSVRTVFDEFGRELPAYDTPYNYCPNCGRKLKEN